MWVQNQRTRVANDVNTSPRAGGDEMCQLNQQWRKRKNYSFLHLSFLFRPLIDWTMPNHIREGSLPRSLIQMLILPRNSKKQCLIWVPVTHSCWYREWTIMLTILLGSLFHVLSLHFPFSLSLRIYINILVWCIVVYQLSLDIFKNHIY